MSVRTEMNAAIESVSSPFGALARAATVSASSDASGIELERIVHRYGGAIAVNDVSLDIRPGELVALLGPSGCGKTTLLRIIAGLLAQSEGQVRIGGETVDRLPPNERGAGIVFQSYALFPHMTVAANVEYGLRARGLPAAQRRPIVERMLALVRMDTLARRYPRELSGGQQQRVALARTLAVSPRVLLLDEPFGALDKNLRLGMQIEVKRLQRELSITTVMVTHDQEEALSMADRIAVMSNGVVEQLGTPEEIYDRPRTQFVAEFVGHTNLLSGRLARAADGFEVTLDVGGTLHLAEAAPCSRNGAVRVSVRPEHLEFATSDAATIPAVVELVLPLGPSVVYELALANGEKAKVTLARTGGAPAYRPGETARLRVAGGAPVSVFQS
jgi:putative spermidine/putrescine transport system ATP-binding protein